MPRPLTLAQVRPCLEGVIPATMATVAADGTPNVAYISQVHYIDDGHLGLSFQFFNKTRQNLLHHPRATLLVLHPQTARYYRLHLAYLRTETEGPVFESMKAQLAGIASHTGMADVFRLRGSDIHRVLSVELLPSPPPPLPLAPPEPGPDRLGILRRGVARIAQACQLGEVLDVALDVLQSGLGIEHAMVLILDAASGRLYTVASCGYQRSGVGSEIALGDGVIGTAAREHTAVRITHMTAAYRYSQAMRGSLDTDAAGPAGADIPYPGLPEPRSQLAVPLLSMGRLLGVLFVESEQDMRFCHEDEDALVALAAPLAGAIDLMQETGAACSDPPAPLPASTAVESAEPLRVRRYRSNDSIFVNDTYLIKGVAGAILWKLLGEWQSRRRSEFTNRELRLDTSLGLPDVADNLEARLFLLHRRLAEQCPRLRIEKTGRGSFRFLAPDTLVLEDVPG